MRKLIIIIFTIALVVLGIVATILFINSKNTKQSGSANNYYTISLIRVDEKTALEARDTITMEISGLPSTMPEKQQRSLKNSLAYTLRQKYGANKYTGVARDNIIIETLGITVLVDVKDIKETYELMYNPETNFTISSCAQPEQQMDQATYCENYSGPDVDYDFPKG